MAKKVLLKIGPIDNFYCSKFRISQIDFLRLQSIRKSKQISGQMILSSPQDLEFNPNFAKNRDIPVVKNSVTRPVTPVLRKIRFKQFT